MDCRSTRLTEGNNNNPCMRRMKQRYGMVKITVRSENRRIQTLCGCKHRLVIISKVTNIFKQNNFVPAQFNQVGGGAGKILIKQELHIVAMRSV